VIRLGPWHIEIEITPEVSTRAALEAPAESYPEKSFYRMSFHSPKEGFMRKMKRIFPDGLEGRSVLDCACNCGAYLLWCKELGAGECYGFDAREHWIRQARFLAERRGQTDGVRFGVHALDELDEVDPGRFDVTLFNGIFYHLPDPVHGLKLAADRTGELLIVNTATRLGVPDGALVVAREKPERAMSGVHGLNWFPTGPAVMSRILDWMEFPEVRCSRWRVAPQQDARLGRLEMLAAREPGFFAAYDGALPDARERVRELVSTTVPPGASVAVVTPDGWEPLDFEGRESLELAPGDEKGELTDDEALARLEALRRTGVSYLAVPSACSRWLEERPGLAAYARERQEILAERDGGLVVRLLDSDVASPETPD
jgi:tRNA (mo5U34)-methyltransferase